MKANIYTHYGTPEDIQFVDVETPAPGDNDVLVRVRAASMNASDCEMLKGSPLYVRLWGLRRPVYQTLGSDVAGTVVSVGKNISHFKAGDEVFGDLMGTFGGFAEYVCAPAKALMIKPAAMSFEAAATLPQAALVAYQGLINKAQLQSAESVLINGAGGGTGSFAIQIAKLFGARVSAVDSGPKQNLMRSLGADEVYDYTLGDVTQNGCQYDVIFDVVASHSVADYSRLLAPGGRYVMAGGTMKHILGTLIKGSWISQTQNKKMGILAAETNGGLQQMAELVVSNAITPVIDRRYHLDDLPRALRYFAQGRAQGKILIIP